MIKSYEFQGKSVETALERASEELNVPSNQLNYEVLTYGSTGIFGLVGVKKAKIKVTVELKEEQPIDVESASEIPASATGNKKNIDDYLDQLKTNQEEFNDENESDSEIIEFGTQALIKIIDSISSDTTVKSKRTKEKLFFSVTGGDSGVLIGKRGQTLEAIQYLLEKMINKKTSKKIRVLVDVEGYLEKRKNNLKQLASRMAEKAKKIKKPVTIGQMNAHDRRIVHIHLKDENGIRTQSIGDGYYRKLMIFPKKRGSSRGSTNNS